MPKKLDVVTLVVSILAIILSAAAFVNTSVSDPVQTDSTAQEASGETDIQYVMYLGTNDKDTNEPVFAPDEAKEKAEEILLDHFGGYTIQEANGGWKDGDIVYTEYTLVIYLSDTTLKDVHAAADEMVKTFHQSSVLIQANETTTEFYSGE
jgi:hypothetical protein